MKTGRSKGTAGAQVDDGIRAAQDAYDGMDAELRPVALTAYKGQGLRPIGAKVHDLPLRRCPGCQSRNAAPIGYGPGKRLVYGCPVCRRRHFADVDD